ARATATLERERFLFFRLQDPGMTPEKLTACFLRPPLYTTAYGRRFGTVYTAVYRPQDGQVRYLWPDGHWDQSLAAFTEGRRRQQFHPEDELPDAAS
ncbi:MAG: hypothetical protein HY057_10045, partial [Rhodospirillales bacterium]|nr:hypothetical protein [Rhodospirillales bacterium]